MIPDRLRSAMIPIALAAALLTTGCAAPARVSEMSLRAEHAATLSTAERATALRHAVSVRDVAGGRDTNPMWTSQVASTDFERALEASLRSAGFLSENRQTAPYAVLADIVKLDQPFLGLDLTVTASVNYTVVNQRTKLDVFSRTITTPYTATFSDSALAVERLRLANEGAIRQNITKFLQELVAALSK
jgi:hypothetical protein